MSRRARHLGYVLKRFPRISETFVAAELIELERQGERVTVFAVSRPEEPFTHRFLADLEAAVIYLPRRPLREPVRVLRALGRVVRSNSRGWLNAAAVSLWPPRLRGLRRLLQATVLRDEMRAAGIHHAHAHFASTATRLANLAWRMGGPSYSVTAHAKDIYHRQVRVDRLQEKLASAVFVATVTRANRDYLDALLAGQGSFHVVPNAVDLRRVKGSVDGRREAGLILSVARLVEKKGLSDLVLASGLLAQRQIRHRLLVVGEGPLRGELEACAASARAPATFLGALSNEDVLRLYRRASVFGLPCVVAPTGDRDGLPTSVLEAMALGTPVVATCVNGLAEVVVHERTGLAVPEGDPFALADAIERLLRDGDLALRLAAQARLHVARGFSLESSVARLRTLFPEPA
jgi:colanic acid/amylovoran biosynthesis glycosyltransferase